MQHVTTQIGNRRYDLIGQLAADPLGRDGDWIFTQRSGDQLPDHCEGSKLTFSFRLHEAIGRVFFDPRSRHAKVVGASNLVSH